MVMQTEEQQGQSVPLRFFEYGQEIGAAHEQQGSNVVQRVEEVDRRYHQPAQNHHQRCVVLVHALEQPVESQNEEDSDGPGEQVADDAKTEEKLVRGDIVGRRGRVATHEQSAGNVDEAQGGGEYQ